MRYACSLFALEAEVYNMNMPAVKPAKSNLGGSWCLKKQGFRDE